MIRISRIIAVDFDDTLFNSNHYDVGTPKWDIINKVKAEKRKGSKIILWTCRQGEALQEAIDACNSVGLTFDAINDNIKEVTDAIRENPRKVIATEYWDDHARRIK